MPESLNEKNTRTDDLSITNVRHVERSSRIVILIIHQSWAIKVKYFFAVRNISLWLNFY